MIKQINDTDIIRLAKSVDMEFSAEECEHMRAHIRKQLHSFEALNDIDTDGVEPTFYLHDGGGFKASRSGK